MFRLLALTALIAAASGCVEYNETCTAPVEGAKDEYARLAAPLYLDKNNTRHASNAFGQVAADAFRDAFAGTTAAADLGIINSGDIRNEGFCAPRNIVKDRLLHGDVYEILLFDNLIYSLEVTEDELVAAFQHSVNTLTVSSNPAAPAPQEIASAPARFLQVSGDVQMTVDCTIASGSNRRVTELKINGAAVNLASPSPTRTYRVAMPEFLMLGGDGYSTFKKAYDERQVFSQTPRNEKEAQLTAAYLKKNFAPKDKPKLALDPQRVVLKGCAIPLPPSAP